MVQVNMEGVRWTESEIYLMTMCMLDIFKFHILNFWSHYLCIQGLEFNNSRDV